MIKLTEQLYAVEVPADAFDFKAVPMQEKSFLNYFANNKEDIFQLLKSDFDFEILGEVTADSISFDVEPYLKYDKYLNRPIDYRNTDLVCKDKNESFYSLLHSKGLYFVNPIEKPTHYDEWISEYNKGIEHGYEKHIMLKYKEAESKLIKKCVILKRL